MISLSSVDCGRDKNKPNIILILADDLGVNDVSWNNPESPTPTLGRLSERGVVLDNLYTLPICTPSRAALLTGVYPFRFGFQRGFGPTHPEGIPTSLPLISQQLKESGYNNSILGKWHLGFCSEQYVPTNRGFDYFSGLYVGDTVEEQNAKSDIREEYETNYFSKKAVEIIKKSKHQPFFLYMSLFTKAYPRESTKYQTLAQLRYQKIKDMDTAVNKIVKALKSTAQYSSTVILFLSDNGAKFEDIKQGYNFPLKGYKGTLYEGGTKVPGFIHSPLLSRSVSGTRYNGLMHMVDILPTILNITGTQMAASTDGINHWPQINGNQGQIRETMVYNVDDNFLPAIYSAKRGPKKFQIVVREKDMKLMWGQANVILKSSREKEGSGIRFNQELLELYDLSSDPSETQNLAKSRPNVVKRLKEVGLSYYHQQQPELFREYNYIAKQEVLDSRLPHSGVTGWCSPIQKTTCQGVKFVENDYDLIKTFYGTLNSSQPIHCKLVFSK